MTLIPFNKPYMTGKELDNIAEANSGSKLAGDGPFTKKCHEWIEGNVNVPQALLTHSCTAALEMSALLIEIEPGDEIILPSYTFVSTANAFVLRGAVPVFIDIREDTLNIDENLIEQAITTKTRAILPVHYAGVACEMDTILAIADKHDLVVIEDAAQGVMASYKGRPLGGIGELGAFSFHETKNIISGEGGCLLVNSEKYEQQAEIIREKGTDRSRFFRSEVDKYTWQEMGSSFLPGELTAAFLWAQLEDAEEITKRRIANWNIYHSLLETFEQKGVLRRPTVPKECLHNGHMYYVLIPEGRDRQVVIEKMNSFNIHTLFHYVPLHSSPAGMKFGRTSGSLAITDSISQRILRLPLWIGITEEEQKKVVESLCLYSL